MPACSIVGCSSRTYSKGWCAKHYFRWKRHGDVNHEPVAHHKPTLEYLRQVVLPYQGDECLIWPYGKISGYGAINLKGRSSLVSRVVCEEIHGPPNPANLEAAHSCGKGHLGCVSPRHLSWKTASENFKDRDRHGTYPRGKKVAGCKLDEETVRTIRSLKGILSQAELGRRFGVRQDTISRVQSGSSWKWLT